MWPQVYFPVFIWPIWAFHESLNVTRSSTDKTKKEKWGLETLHVDFLFQSNFYWSIIALGFPGGSDGKKSACNVGNPGLIPGLGRSPGEGNGNPLQYSCLEDPMDRGAWWATVHGVTKSWTQQSGWAHTDKYCICKMQWNIHHISKVFQVWFNWWKYWMLIRRSLSLRHGSRHADQHASLLPACQVNAPPCRNIRKGDRTEILPWSPE